MAHRQSGSYKEEPGVAVAVPGDHVSFLLLLHSRFVKLLVVGSGREFCYLRALQLPRIPRVQLPSPSPYLFRPHEQTASCPAMLRRTAARVDVEGCFRTAFQKTKGIGTRGRAAPESCSSEHVWVGLFHKGPG